jgi:hypothetical protein
MHPSTPRTYAAWQSLDHPLTCWHITYCAPEDDGTTHTCLGFSRSHGVFDGIGAAQIVQAVVAELERRPWDVPSLPKPGLNENRVMRVLEPELQARQRRKKDYVDQSSYTPVGIGGALWVAGWHLREKYWRGADRRLVFVPQAALNYLVDDVRAQLKRDLCHTKVSTGDILTAWIYKVCLAVSKPDYVLAQLFPDDILQRVGPIHGSTLHEHRLVQILTGLPE